MWKGKLNVPSTDSWISKQVSVKKNLLLVRLRVQLFASNFFHRIFWSDTRWYPILTMRYWYFTAQGNLISKLPHWALMIHNNIEFLHQISFIAYSEVKLDDTRYRKYDTDISHHGEITYRNLWLTNYTTEH
jgi:hypothetical protein